MSARGRPSASAGSWASRGSSGGTRSRRASPAARTFSRTQSVDAGELDFGPVRAPVVRFQQSEFRRGPLDVQVEWTLASRSPDRQQSQSSSRPVLKGTPALQKFPYLQQAG